MKEAAAQNEISQILKVYCLLKNKQFYHCVLTIHARMKNTEGILKNVVNQTYWPTLTRLDIFKISFFCIFTQKKQRPTGLDDVKMNK